MNRSLKLSEILGIFALCLMLGCSDGYPDTVPVKCAITLDGVPFPNARITATPTDGSRGAIGVSDANGVATFSTFTPEDGLVLGTHKLSVSSKLPPPMPGSTTSPLQEEQEKKMREAPENQTPKFPEKYGNQYTSDLTITVESNTTEVSVNMVSGK